jgi:protein-S-isoprenylcysteine O-methyltransferase Ste14
VQTQPDNTTRFGGWLFRHRTSLPVPIAIAILVVPVDDASRTPLIVWSGVGVTLLGELIRFWGVHHIGAISRTRSERLGPLVDSGPFAIVRNPLYIGNILLWVGFALTARLVWLTPIVLVLLGAEYHAIVRWEESLLESRLGDAYVDYTARVNRWLPGLFNRRDRKDRGEENLFERNPSALSAPSAVKQTTMKPYFWSETLFSERGTLLAIAAGYLLLWLKSQL